MSYAIPPIRPGVSAPVPTTGRHLLTADDSVNEGSWYGAYLTLCGALLGELPSAECPQDCERLECLVFCARCVEVAVERNAELFTEAAMS